MLSKWLPENSGSLTEFVLKYLLDSWGVVISLVLLVISGGGHNTDKFLMKLTNTGYERLAGSNQRSKYLNPSSAMAGKVVRGFYMAFPLCHSP
jgi:hypothetical protein